MFNTAKALFIFGLIFLPVRVFGADVAPPDVSIRERAIHVKTGLVFTEEDKSRIRSGAEKDIEVQTSLFRVWETWPDEFVLGKSLTKTLHCDPVKNEFIGTSVFGNEIREKRFKSCESLLMWAVEVPEVRLTSTKELEPAKYFIRVTATSRLRRLPPVIGQLLFFVPKNEFEINKDSAPFDIGANGR